MFWQTAVIALLASGAQAGIGALVAEGMSRNSPALERRLQEMAMASLESRGHIESRATNSSLTPTNSTSTSAPGFNTTAWDDAVTAACTSALMSIPQATNPSGTCVCYNLPTLNNVTGAFEADLRLYQVSPPSGSFAGISQQNINVELAYSGASASAVTPDAAASVASSISARQAPSITLLSSYMFIGQINMTVMSQPVTVAALEAAVMPIVTLSAVNTQGQTVSTNVSANEASFVHGVFADAVFMSDTALASLAVDDQVNGLQNGTVAFVLPGVQILIFPIGLIITSAWTVLGVAAYAIGTMGRINYAEQFKRRTQTVAKSGVARI